MNLLCCCTSLDLKAFFGKEFARQAPEVTLLTPEMVTDRATIDAAICFKPAADAFEDLPNLRAIFSAGAGFDAIMACPSLPQDVPVLRVEDPDQALQMAGTAAFHVLWHHRQMGKYVADQASATWAPVWAGLSPARKRIGVLGFGLMGRAVARGLVGLGYPVAGYSRRMPEAEPGVTHYTEGALDDFLAASDILINVLPLTPATQGLLDAKALAKLPQGAALIHLGRGGQVVEADLIAALDRGHLSGASLDVFATEPLPKDDPLWAHPKVFVSPHVASIPEARGVVRSIVTQLRSL